MIYPPDVTGDPRVGLGKIEIHYFSESRDINRDFLQDARSSWIIRKREPMQDSSEAINILLRKEELGCPGWNGPCGWCYLSGMLELLELGLSLVGEKATNRISFRLHGCLKVHMEISRVAFKVGVNRSNLTLCPVGGIGRRARFRI